MCYASSISSFPVFPCQDPKFPPNEDGKAMRKRIQKFDCKAITPVVRNMEILYRQQAMEIIHWMTIELQVLLSKSGSFSWRSEIGYHPRSWGFDFSL